MKIDYEIVIGVVLLLLVIWFFIRKRNRKDKVELEEQIIKSDLKPDQHDEPHV